MGWSFYQHQQGQFGRASLELDGIFTKDQIPGHRHLVFDVYLPDYDPCHSAHLKENLGEFPHFSNVHFEIRNDSEYSWMGLNIWRSHSPHVVPPAWWGAHTPFSLPPYEDAINFSPSSPQQLHLLKHPYTGREILGQRLKVLIANGDWGRHFCSISFPLYISKDLPSDECCLSNKFFKNGFVFWENQVTYFFPLQRDLPSNLQHSSPKNCFG